MLYVRLIVLVRLSNIYWFHPLSVMTRHVGDVIKLRLFFSLLCLREPSAEVSNCVFNLKFVKSVLSCCSSFSSPTDGEYEYELFCSLCSLKSRMSYFLPASLSLSLLVPTEDVNL